MPAALIALALAAAPQRSTDRLPRAEPIPLAGDEAAAGPLAAVRRLVDAMSARDAAAVLAAVRPDGAATAMSADGVRRSAWADYAARLRPGPERREERLLDPAVEVDGDVAMVWTPYDFTIDGRRDHCGADLFDVVREGGRWRVLNATWTQRPCG